MSGPASRLLLPARRDFMVRGGALVGGLYLAPAIAGTESAEKVLDFRGGIPAGVQFRRAGAASAIGPDGVLRQVGADVPRFMLEGGKPLGLLIEGAATNLLRNPHRPDQGGWKASAAISLSAEAGELAPDGSSGLFRIKRGVPTQNSSLDAVITGLPWMEYSTASVWLRASSGRGTWRLRLYDMNTYNGTATVVEVGPEWRRYALGFAWQMRDTGAKRFSVVFNDPPPKSGPAAPFQLNRVNPNLPVATPLTLESALMWGAQYEEGNGASSFVFPSGSSAARPPDVVTFPASLLPAQEGALTFHLPQGGRRAAVLLDANGTGGGILLEYSNSGWLKARVGKVELAGFGDASADQVVRLEWNGSGVQILSGDRPLTLAVRASLARDPRPLALGDSVRVGMTQAGERPLNRVLATLAIGTGAASPGVAMLPTVRPLSYVPSFRDDFSNDDVGRINENARGGSPEAPAWRSRFHHARKEVINQEKQIYMDPEFAGTAERPLGVQPFSIKDGILRIKAERADPQRVAPHIWNYQYTSGCITSELSHWQTYGYFEMRARLPRGKGFWPAFWLLPKRQAWPPEIDILEGSGARPYGVHCGVLEKPRSANTPPGAWIDQLVDTTDGFHTYAVDWTQSNIVFFVDGVKTFEYGPHNIHEDMYMLINLALGSRDPNWIPDPDASTPFPGVLEIDYVQAFKRAA